MNTNPSKPSPAVIAKQIKDAADKYGYKILVRDGILTIHKNFTPESREGFVECDTTYYSVLGLLPRSRPGSDWGTDGSGIGALSAMKSGRFVMNRSGGNKRVLAELNKIV